VLPTTPLMGLAMACSGLLRSVGDARRAMYVTLAGGLVTAVCDPLLIFGFGLGVDGAALTSILARLAMVALGFHGCGRVHDLLGAADRRAALADARPLAAIAVPAVLANIATPFGNAIVTAAVARYGDSAVAGYAVIGRVVPLAFGAIFALAGSIGPILGQNFGAARFDRVRGAVRDGMTFTTLYCLAMCVALLLLREPIVRAFGASGEGADLIRFFCIYLSWSWIAVGWLFVANAAFNNLGFPTWSTVFNWGRATVGTVPFVWIGATQFGAAGVIAGQGAGGAVFAIGAVVVCFMVIGRLAAPRPRAQPDEVASVAEVPPFSSEKAATAIEWAEPDEKVK
jgi:Na+-driven multidrug efflux pump